jgi:hypothetical protein
MSAQFKNLKIKKKLGPAVGPTCLSHVFVFPLFTLLTSAAPAPPPVHRRRPVYRQRLPHLSSLESPPSISSPATHCVGARPLASLVHAVRGRGGARRRYEERAEHAGTSELSSAKEGAAQSWSSTGERARGRQRRNRPRRRSRS